MSNPVFIKVSIPVKPHIKKYLVYRYGQEHTMTKNSLLGILLFHVLDKETPKSEISYKEYVDRYEIQVSEYYFSTRGYVIGDKKRKYLAQCFEKIFNEDMHLFIDLCIWDFRISAAEAMRKFLLKYKISENDVKYESIYRQYQRYSQENITQKKVKLK